jgi:hypothetical protein
MLKTPTARLAAHTAIAFLSAFLPLLLATSQPLTKELVISSAVAAARVVIGLTTSTNPQVGKNVV